ncbi:MAG: O-antigen ligase family protein [Firmicutes bacterium]|nr:O-antigen ligase family protein [Bacillota bacterium]
MINKISYITKYNRRFVKRIKNLEWIMIFFFFVFSFINNVTLIISFVSLLFFLYQKEIGAIKILNLIVMRTIINPGIAISLDSLQNIKWVIVFICSFYLISGYKKVSLKLKKKLNKVLFAVLLFGSYNMFSSFFFSTLPVVAIFKLISYIVVFIGVMIGVANTNDKYNWLDWMYTLMKIIFITSIPYIGNNIGYLINGHAFQGITNQPNMFGILAALFIALIVTRIQLKRFNGRFEPLILISVMMYMLILSKSRTGFITAIITILFFLMFSNINMIKKIMALNLFGIITVLYALFDGELFNFFQQFLYKGQEDILFSRMNQVNELMYNFLKNPFFGSGFAVPVIPYRSFAFSTEYIVEPGNLLLAVLSYGGIIGFVFFLNYIIQIYISNKEMFKYFMFLPFTTIMISMGEMVFFSSNNIGIWLYMALSIYIFDGKTRNEYSAPPKVNL